MFMRTTKYRQYAIKAVIKLDTGPASAVSAMPQRLFLKLAILTGTGRAQPKPNIFLEKLLAIDTKPKDMKDEMTWYLNIATAFNVLGKRNECIALFKQLEEVATEKDKEYIQNSIKFVQEQLEK